MWPQARWLKQSSEIVCSPLRYLSASSPHHDARSLYAALRTLISATASICAQICVHLAFCEPCANAKAHFVSMDETVWTPTFQLTSGLRSDNKKYILGGLWSPVDAEDFSALTSASKIPDEKLAKLTCHFLVCRCDGQAKDTRYGLCMLSCPSNGKTDLFCRILGMCVEVLTLNNGLRGGRWINQPVGPASCARRH